MYMAVVLDLVFIADHIRSFKNLNITRQNSIHVQFLAILVKSGGIYMERCTK